MNCAPKGSSIDSLISRVPMFEGLSPEELLEISVGARKTNAARGEMLFRQGDACTGLFVIVYGQVKLFFSSPLGSEKILEVLSQFQTLGESTLFQGKSYLASAQTLNECMLIHLSKASILAALETNQSFARRVIDNLANSVSWLTQNVESYSLHSGRQRVINYLAREALRVDPALQHLQEGRPKDSLAKGKPPGLIIRLPTSKGVIASCLSLTQEHFSRILHDLSMCGLLSVEGRDIHVENLAQFWQCACQIVLQSENEHQMALDLMESSERPARRELSRPVAGEGIRPHLVA